MKKTEKDMRNILNQDIQISDVVETRIQAAGEEGCPSDENKECFKNCGSYRGGVSFRSGCGIRILKDRIFPGDVR